MGRLPLLEEHRSSVPKKKTDKQRELIERLPCNGLHRYRFTGGPERKDVLTMFFGI